MSEKPGGLSKKHKVQLLKDSPDEKLNKAFARNLSGKLMQFSKDKFRFKN